jgi:hypothetical protein
MEVRASIFLEKTLDFRLRSDTPQRDRWVGIRPNLGPKIHENRPCGHETPQNLILNNRIFGRLYDHELANLTY